LDIQPLNLQIKDCVPESIVKPFMLHNTILLNGAAVYSVHKIIQIPTAGITSADKTKEIL
jgi:hypothetical protein